MLRPIEPLNLLSKHDENAASRLAGFEPVSEWVSKKILLCASFVGFQSTIENKAEVRGCGSRVSVRHKSEVRIVEWWVMGKEKMNTGATDGRLR